MEKQTGDFEAKLKGLEELKVELSPNTSCVSFNHRNSTAIAIHLAASLRGEAADMLQTYFKELPI